MVYDKDNPKTLLGMIIPPQSREATPDMTPKPFVEGIFGAAVVSAGLNVKSTLNPLGMVNNCVSVTLARLLGLKDSTELKRIAGVAGREDTGLTEEEIYGLLHKLKKTFVFQVRPSRTQIESAFMQVDLAFDVDEVGIAYLRPRIEGQDFSQGHCVVYHRDKKPGLFIFSDDSEPYRGRFEDYQTDSGDPNLQDEIENCSVILAFICVDVQLDDIQVAGMGTTTETHATLKGKAGNTEILHYSDWSNEARRRVKSGNKEEVEATLETQYQMHLRDIQEHGIEDPCTLRSESDLAILYILLNRSSEAEPFQVHVVETRRRLLGPEDPDTILAMLYLTAILSNLDKHQEAEDLASSARETALRVLGPDHEITLALSSHLVGFYKERGNLSAAVQPCKMIVEGWRKAKGDTDDHTISSLAYLQLIYEGLEKWTEATTIAEELLSALLKAGDKGNANIIANGKKLASTLVDHGHNKDAKKLMERIFEVQKQVLGLHNDAMASTIV